MNSDNRELTLAHHMADVAGDILRRYWRQPIAGERKADLSPVTHADREAETAMRALIASAFPEHGIYGEEFGQINPDATCQWVLDPIDGTRSFIAGYPIFTTLIALVKNGVPVLGIIDQPVNKERWVGIAGEQTTCNERPARTRDTGLLKHANLATTSTYYFSKEEAALFEKIKNISANVQLGGDAYAYAMLASGALDVVIDASMKPYDFCALKPVIEGAGGFISDWNGNPLAMASDGRVVAAATKELYGEILKILRTTTV